MMELKNALMTIYAVLHDGLVILRLKVGCFRVCL